MAAITSVIGSAYTSVSFIRSFHPAIDRQHLALADQQSVTRHDRFDGDLDDLEGLLPAVATAVIQRRLAALLASASPQARELAATNVELYRQKFGDLDGDGTAELYAAVGSTITQERWDGVQFVTRYFRGRPSEGTPQVADVDGDGDNEILVPQERGLAVIETLVETPAPVTMQEATAADLDADGDLDVVLRAGFGDRLCWLRNEGGTLGHFSCSAATPRGFAVADLTGDQRADVIVADETIDLLVTDADGLSTTPLTLRSDAGANAVSIARGGAEPRLVVSEFDDRLTVYPITPTALGTPVLEADTGNFGRIWVGDVDGDGIDDIITQSGDDGSSLYRGAAASFSAAEPFTEQIAPVVASGDIDGDGTLDILTREEVLWGPTFADATRFLPQSLTAVAVAAIDSDAALEVVAGNADQTVVVGFGADRVPEASRAYGAPGPVALADIDGDGVLDLISVTGALTVTRGVSGGFDAPPFAQTGGDVPAEAFAADLDGDGRHELAVGHLNAGLTVSRRDADGVWTPTLVADATQPLSATPADFDQDGYTELLVTGSNVGGLAYDAASYFVEAEGDGFLTTELPGTGYRAVVGRFDDDAYPDYALLSRIVGDRAIYIQDEEQGWVQGDELSQHLGLVGGDFDGDGRVELLQFADTNTFGWLLFDVGTDGALSEPVALDFVETSPAIAADVNGDGLDDVIGIEGAATDAATIRIYWGTDGIGIDPANFAKVALGHPVTSVETASLDDRDGLELIMTTADISTIVGWDGAAPTRLGTYAEGRIGGAGDFDADGRFELVQLRAHGVRLIDSTCSN